MKIIDNRTFNNRNRIGNSTKKGGKKASITSDFVSDLSEQAYASKPDVDVEDVEDDFEMPLEVEILDDDN